MHHEYRPKEFCVDRHLHDMLIFHQRTDFHAHPLYVNGNIILQVKSLGLLRELVRRILIWI